jgi:ELWxxDGT repeat protein
MKKNYSITSLFLFCINILIAQQASLVKNVDGTANDGSGYFNNGIFLVGDSLFLFPGNSFFPGTELFRSNGTAGGTYLTKDIYPGSTTCWYGLSTNRAYSNGKQLFFQAQEPGDGFELWTSNGSDTGTYKLKDFNPGFNINSNPQNFVSPDQKRVFFKAFVYNSLKTCVTDGTIAGTDSTSINAAELPNLYCNGYYYYTKASPFSGFSNDIWRLDTANLQAQFVYDSDSVNHEGHTQLITVYADSLILYKAQVDTSIHMYTFNVNTGQVTQLPEVHTTYPNLKQHYDFYRIPNSDYVLFSAKSIDEGVELWVCDGLTVKLLSDINTGVDDGIAQPNVLLPNYIEHNGWIYFTAYRNGFGTDIFKTDGTSAGTSLAYDFPTFPITYPVAPICSGGGYLIGGIKTCVGGPACYYYDLFILDNGSAIPLMNSANEQLKANDNYRFGIEMGGDLYIMAYANSTGREIYKLNGLVTQNTDTFNTLEFNFFPNPANNELTVQCNNNTSLSIMDMMGQQVYDMQIKSNLETIDISAFSQGIYMIKVGNSYSKFIKN